MEDPTLSLVVPTYNRADLLERFLSSLDPDYGYDEIVIVNDGSEDNTKDVAESYDTKLVNTQGVGLIGARKVGIEASSGEIIGFAEDDMVLKHDPFETVKNHFINGEQFVQIGVIFEDKGKNRERDSTKPIASYKWNFQHTTNWNMGIKPTTIPFAQESGTFVSKELLSKVPMYDDNLIGAYGESQSFSYRARNSGYQILFDPKVRFHHLGAEFGGSTQRFDKTIERGCTKFDRIYYHNMFYIHARFHTSVLVPAIIFHIFMIFGKVLKNRDIKCFELCFWGSLMGMYKGLETKIRSS